jgi:UDP-N-acetylmuramoyl-tripeptide--D-alanyl-D-alanine ligase
LNERTLWTVEAMAQAMGADIIGMPPAACAATAITGISIDSRTATPGDAFFAIQGDNRDGHDFVAAAFGSGVTLAVIAAAMRANFPDHAPLLVVDDVLDGLRALARAARARTDARVIGVTGSVGKTGTKEMLRQALGASGETHASVASYNNHWGVPLSLARCPAEVRYAVFELGMNHAGEIDALVRLVRPHVAMITTIAPVHLEYFGSLEAIADAKAEIFAGLEPGGAAVLNRDGPQFARLERAAKDAGVARIVTCGAGEGADARLLGSDLHGDHSAVRARILGTEVAYTLGAPGAHLVANSLAVLAAAVLAGADLKRAAQSLGTVQAPRGRGARVTLGMAGGTALLIDESYNANPASMAAALALLGRAGVARDAGHGPGRRIAVLGDMLELGPAGAELHAGLAEPVAAHGIDLVYCCGPLMKALWEALPPARRGGYAKDSGALESQLVAALRPGDAVMVKGSLGSRMGPIVKTLEGLYPSPAAPHPASAPSSTSIG